MGLEASNDGGVSIDDLYCFLSRKGHIRRIGCGLIRSGIVPLREG